MVCSPHNYVVQQVATGIDYASVRNIVYGELQKQAAGYQMAPQTQRLYSGSPLEEGLGVRMYGTTPDRSPQQQYEQPQQVTSDLFLGEGMRFVTPQQPQERELLRTEEQPVIPYQNLLLTYLTVLKTDKKEDTNQETQRRRDDLAQKIEEALAQWSGGRTTKQQDKTTTQPQMMRLYN